MKADWAIALCLILLPLLLLVAGLARGAGRPFPPGPEHRPGTVDADIIDALEAQFTGEEHP